MSSYLQVFIPVTAMWLSIVCFGWREEEKPHLALRMTLCVGCVYLLAVLLSLVAAKEVILVRILWRLFAAPVLGCFIYACWKLSASLALYYAMWSFMLWQLQCELWFILISFGKGAGSINPNMELLISILVFAIGNIIVFLTIARWMPMDGNQKIGPRQLVSAILIFTTFEIYGYTMELQKIQPGKKDWQVVYLTQLLLLVILYLQSELFKKSALRQELAVMNLLWKKEQEQYELSKENIALINQKCHDLKHQLRAMKSMSYEEICAYLTEMEDSVKIYETIVKSGNEVLDTILTEKSLYCKERGITVSCVVDGSQLGFINTIDLYAILGNAMDNAIEAVEKFKHVEKRQIDVCIYRSQQFLVMNIINPMKEKLVYEEELPRTTKKDTLHHGYGLKSIQYMVRKYHGCLNISEEDNCFSLKILIPIPESENTSLK